MDLGEVVDLDRYPVHHPRRRSGLANVLADDLSSRSVAVLPGFVRPAALQLMSDDCDRLRPAAHRSSSTASPYLAPPDPAFPEGHPRSRSQLSSVETVAYDRVPADAPIRGLYESEVLVEFLGEVLGVPQLFRYGDPFGALNLATMVAGDSLGWHFDQADFVTSIAIAAPSSGGAFEVAPQLRHPHDENYAAVQAVLDGDRTGVTHIDFRPGSLMLFAGRNSLHRVTAVNGGRPRHVALLAYDTQPGTDSTDELKRARYGRLPSSTGTQGPAHGDQDTRTST